jgi:hypothetical protein
MYNPLNWKILPDRVPVFIHLIHTDCTLRLAPAACPGYTYAGRYTKYGCETIVGN